MKQRLRAFNETTPLDLAIRVLTDFEHASLKDLASEQNCLSVSGFRRSRGAPRFRQSTHWRTCSDRADEKICGLNSTCLFRPLAVLKSDDAHLSTQQPPGSPTAAFPGSD